MDTFSSGKRSPGLVAFTNTENAGEPSGKAVTIGIFHINYIKRTRMSLTVGDHTNSSQISIPGHHIQVTRVKVDGVGNLASLQINLNGVVHRYE